MDLRSLAVLIGCVVGISLGQILFKLCSRSLGTGGSPTALFTNPWFLLALAIYGAATLAWVYELRRVDLSMAYPLMALSFVLVPLAATFIFGERLSLTYWTGAGLILVGICLAVWSTQNAA